VPHHDEIDFRLVLKALIHVKLLRETNLATQEQRSQYSARQNEATPAQGDGCDNELSFT
jgi:hypothetical protein